MAAIDPDITPVGGESVTPTEETTPYQPKGGETLEESTIEKSEKEEEQLGFDPSFPVLFPPFTINWSAFMDAIMPDFSIFGATGPSSASLAYFQNRMHEITISMLNKWNESIQEIEKQKKLEENSPARRAFEDYLHRIETGNDPSQVMKLATVTAFFILGTSFIGDLTGLGSVAEVGTIDLNIVQQVQHAIVHLVPSDMRAELGYIGAILAAGIMYQTTWITIFGEGAGGAKFPNAAFAKNYAEQVLRQIKDPTFHNFIMAVVIGKMEGAAKLSEGRKEQLAAIVKLVLLFTALALVYKVETGHLTAEEIGGMIKGEIALKEGDPRIPVINAILEQLKFLPEGERVRVLTGLLEYVDSNPNVEELLEPGNVFEGMFRALVSDSLKG